MTEDKYFKRFMKKIEQTSTCWLWKAGKDSKGYAQFYCGKSIQGHVYAYLHFIGSVPRGMELDHLCRVRSCVNPLHLEPVTHKENCRRGDKSKTQTHCRNGHELVEPNLYFGTVERSGQIVVKRACRTCAIERKKARTVELNKRLA